MTTLNPEYDGGLLNEIWEGHAPYIIAALIILFLVGAFILLGGLVSKEELYERQIYFCNGLSATPFAEEVGYIEADSVGNIFRCGKCWDNTKECWDDPLDNALYIVCDYPFGTNEITTIGCGGNECRWQCDNERRYGERLRGKAFMDKARYTKEYWRKTWGIDNPYELQKGIEK